MLGMGLYTQLVHWSEPLARSYPDADDDHVTEEA